MKDLVFEMRARALGECALVPDPSPISQSGITFFNTFSMKMLQTTWLWSTYATSVVGGEMRKELKLQD